MTDSPSDLINKVDMGILNKDELKKEVKAHTIALLKVNKELETEISERKKAELLIMQSLREKDILLKEIHHRVKNNLQVISSLVNLQSKNLSDKIMKNAFLEIQNRIKSMSLLHENLYQSSNMSEIDIKNYIEKITNDLLMSYGLNSEKIKINIKSENFSIPVDIGSHCGLIINEIVSNSIKHAFPKNGNGKINIKIEHENENLMLYISDNGIGLPKNFDINKTKTLGIQLLKSFVDQLNGNLEISSNNGTYYKIIIPYLNNFNGRNIK